MDAKWNQKGITESMFFWFVFRTPLETSALQRVTLRVSHFVKPIPQGGAILSKITVHN